MRILVSLASSKPISKAAAVGITILKNVRLYTAAKKGLIKAISVKDFGGVKKVVIEYENKSKGGISTMGLGTQSLPKEMPLTSIVGALKAALKTF